MDKPEPFIGPDMMPKDTPDYMFPAWIGCIRWALGEDTIRAAFEKETGEVCPFGREPIEATVDQACGVTPEKYFRAFIEWANVNVWGSMEIRS